MAVSDPSTSKSDPFMTEGETIGGMSNMPIEKSIYVRKAYIDLFSKVYANFDSLREKNDYAIRLTGTPGVGKTYFLGYFWHRLIALKKFTVVAKVKSQAMIYNHEDDSCTEILGDVNCYLKKKGVIFLVDPDDSYVPTQTKAITILFVSPSKKRVGNFSRRNLPTLYMPPWSEEELRDCVQKLYADQACDFDERFMKWGGSIRDVSFASELVESERDSNLQDLLKDSTFINIVNTVASNEYQVADMNAYQWVVHRIPEDNDYRKCSFDFPSPYVSNLILHRIRALKIDWKEIHDPLLLGRLYESDVLEALFSVSDRKSLKVKAHKVGRGRPVQVDLPAVKRQHIFSSRSKIENPEDGTLYIPIESNKPGMDLLMPPWIFQITRAKSHSKKLSNVFLQFPNVEEWKICYIIPQTIEDEFVAPTLNEFPKISGRYKAFHDFRVTF